MVLIPLGFMVMPLGMICVTRRAAAELDRFQANDALTRHMIGDWGEVDEDDWGRNDEALTKGNRVVSSYLNREVRRFLIITEADRSATTILLPEECGAKK